MQRQQPDRSWDDDECFGGAGQHACQYLEAEANSPEPAMAGDRIASHRRRMALNAVLSMGGDVMDDDGFNWWREKCRLGVWGQLTVTLDRLDKSASRELRRIDRGVPGCSIPAAQWTARECKG